jgi:hypothetical protein
MNKRHKKLQEDFQGMIHAVIPTCCDSAGLGGRSLT